MILEALLPPLCVAMAGAGSALVHARPLRERLAFSIISLCVITPILAERGAFPLPVATLGNSASDWWTRALAILWWIVAARAAAAAIALVLGRDQRSRQAQLLTDLLAGGIWLVASLIILSSVLRLPIGGLLATSGVVAVVIGLAMQNTLGDLFSGIAVGLDQPFHPGDRISVGNTMEGVVIRSNWRSIRVQTDSEDIVTIPNSIVAQSHIVNRTMASERLPVSVEIVLTPAAPPEYVLELLKQAVLLCSSILSVPAPSACLSRLGLRSNAYQVSGYVAVGSHATAARGQLLRQARRVLHHGGIDDGSFAVDALKLLPQVPLFDALNEGQIKQLIDDIRPISLEAGQYLFREGDSGETLFVIGSGVVEVSLETEVGNRKSLRKIGAGDYIGEISLLTGAPRAATASALTRSTVFELPREAIEKLVSSSPDVGLALENAVSRGIDLVHVGMVPQGEPEHEGAHLILTKVREFFERHSFGRSARVTAQSLDG